MEILAQSSADFALTGLRYNFQGSHILGASRGHLCDNVASYLKKNSVGLGVEKNTFG